LRLARETKSKEKHLQTHQSKKTSELTPSPPEPGIDALAYSLLKDPALLYRLGITIQRLGIAGEEANIRLLSLAITSRILRDPISITLKGESSSGKSYITSKVLEVFPPSSYLAMTGMSRQALIYMEQEEFSHRTLVVYEHTGSEAADYNIRTLQSEGNLIFYVTERNPETNKWEARRVEKEGPTNFIFTTTNPMLHPENETRHWSLITDESSQATLAAKIQTAKRYNGVMKLSDEELTAWRRTQDLLKPLNVRIPYARWLAEHTPNQPLRMRRDFNKFLALIETIALLYQHQRNIGEDGTISAGIADYFMAKELVDKVFSASLAGISSKVEALIYEVERLYEKKLIADKQDAAVKPAEIAQALDISPSSVSRWLRPAIESGMVEVVLETVKGRIKSVKPGIHKEQSVNALPTTEQLAESFPELAHEFQAVHPLTGEELMLKENQPTLKIE